MSRVVIVAGEGRYLVNLRGSFIEALCRDGHEVHVIAPADPATCVWLAAHDIAFHEIALTRAGITPVRDVRFALKLRQELRGLNADVVLAYAIKPIVFGIPAALLAGVPRRHALITGLGYAFTPERGISRRSAVNFAARRLYRTSLRLAASVTFQNQDDLEEFRRLALLGTTPAHVVNGSGVELDRYTVEPLPDEPRFLMIGRLLRDKGVGEYLEAARLLKRTHPSASFDLAGPVDSNPSAFPFEEVQTAAAEGVIVYHGPLEDVRPLIAGSRIFVLPSYREGTSRSMLEAMAMGRSVITSDVPGCRAAVAQGDNGILVPPRDSAALARAMTRLMDHPEEASRMGKRSRAIAEQRYDVRQVNAELMRIFGL